MSNVVPLSGFLADLAELIGESGALMLARVYGGRRLYVPESLTPEHDLVRLLGETTAQALVDFYARDRLDIPLGPFSRTGQITRVIRERLTEGSETTAQIAQALNCSERLVWQVKAAMRERHDPNQMSLFGGDDEGPAATPFRRKTG